MLPAPGGLSGDLLLSSNAAGYAACRTQFLPFCF